MKKNICCILSSLIMLCVLYICSFGVLENKVIHTEKNVKFVDSEILLAQVDDNVLNDDVDMEVELEEVLEVTQEEKDEEKVPVVDTDSVIDENVVLDSNDEKEGEIKKETENIPVIKENNNEIIFGKMTGYGPDCYGCSGYLANGMYVGDGTIYYNDSEYGNVRIVAGDRKYKFGTIVKINDSMLAIVLDRGGSIGIGKKFLFDLLYSSEADATHHGVMKDVKFEILRNGF